MLKGKWGGEGGAAELFKELVEGICPQSDNDVVFGQDVTQGSLDARGK